MKLRKVINRVHRGTTYYRWVVNIPPKQVRALGWVDGQKLEMVNQGGTLFVRPARPTPQGPLRSAIGSLADEARERWIRIGPTSGFPLPDDRRRARAP